MYTLNYQGAWLSRVGLKDTMGTLGQSLDKNHRGHAVFIGESTGFSHKIFKR